MTTAVLLAIVPIVSGLALVFAGYPPLIGPFIAGAIGWLIALTLRTPVALVGMRVLGSIERAQTLIIAASGPAEESVRLLAVLLIGRDVATALWLGLGWATIEVLYTFVNGVAIARLAQRTDAEAERVRQLLPPAAFGSSAPFWGAVERVGATALHMGFTLVVAALPISVFINMVVHSSVNLAMVRLSQRWPIAALETIIVIAGFVVLIAGLLLIGAI